MKPGSWALHISVHSEVDAAATWTNMPAAATFLFGSSRHVMMAEISGLTYIRLKVNKQATAGAAAAKLILRWSPTFSTSAASYVDVGETECSVAINTTNAYLNSGWIEISGEMKGAEDVYLAIIGSGGDGVLDPQFGHISIGAI